MISIAIGVVGAARIRLSLLDMRPVRRMTATSRRGKTQRVAYDLISDGFGRANGPFLVTVDTPDGGQTEQAAARRRGQGTCARSTGRQRLPAAPSEDNEMATIFLIPTTSPQDAATSDLLTELRDTVLPDATEGTGLSASTSAATRPASRTSRTGSERLPVFIMVVIRLSVLLLMAAFRSLWVPLVSAVFNLVRSGPPTAWWFAVFQKGIGANLIGVDSGACRSASFIPVMIFAIPSGLSSMDYNVFLLSCIHEALQQRG